MIQFPPDSALNIVRNGNTRLIRLSRLFVLLMIPVLYTTVQAQSGSWEYQEIPTTGFHRYNPQAQFDNWGGMHVVWGTRDPRHSGLQLFYSTDVTGRLGTPFQVTDGPTVFDSTNADIVSFAFRLDTLGRAHVAYIANNNELRLYYTSNTSNEFVPPRELARQAKYDMAVDSLGFAHLIWIDSGPGPIGIYYWTTAQPNFEPTQIASLPGNTRVGYPEVEASRKGIVVAFRTDSSGVYVMRQAPGVHTFEPMQRFELPIYDLASIALGRGDFRIRMALDTAQHIHMLAPHFDSTVGYRLMYATDVGTGFSVRPLTVALDTSAQSFDIAYSSTDHIATTWTTYIKRPWPTLPKVGYAEMIPNAGQPWKVASSIDDLNQSIPGFAYLKGGNRIAVCGDRVVITGLRTVVADLSQQVGLYVRTSLRPRIRYILPDAAAPGMNVVVESYADFHEKGSLGPDGFHPDSVNLELVNSSDTARLVIGPSVVSWDGRLVSTMVFVRQNATPSAVPVRIRVGNSLSNVDTFFVVTPQHIGGETGQLTSSGMLGSGEVYGRRSKRGVLVVDSLVLRNGTFTIDTSDCDVKSPGNQGFLPVTILSQGIIRIDSNATLSVSARHDSIAGVFGTAGPGGGGGGSGGEIGGGSGLAGGGGPWRFVESGIKGASIGTGGIASGRWVGGPSMNGVPGGVTYVDAPSGGGSGHPFGTSGAIGQTSLKTPSLPNPGGYGAGSAGSKPFDEIYPSTGGGGGGNATPGASGGVFGEAANGGLMVGNRQLVPFAGGSGGGGGGYASGGFANGGGGGGAISLMSFDKLVVNGQVKADGANGISAAVKSNSSGGGGGAGGGVLLAAKTGIVLGTSSRVQARPGQGGQGFLGGRSGGDGGAGRVRVDGGANAPNQINPLPQYFGPTTASSTLFPARIGTVIEGLGMPNSTIRILTRPENGSWSYFDPPRMVVVDNDGHWADTLGSEAADGKLYIAVLGRIDGGIHSGGVQEPTWVLSPAGGNMLGRPAVQLDVSDLAFPCIRFDTCTIAKLPIFNSGEFANLVITGARITGPDSARFSVVSPHIAIAPQSIGDLQIRFCPGDTGTFQATLLLPTNTDGPNHVYRVQLTGCGISGRLASNIMQVDLGDICVGGCRDTIIELRNVGDASLTIKDILSNPSELTITVLDPDIPLSIQPGGKVKLHVRICPKHLDATGTVFGFRCNTVDTSLLIVVRGRNIGPDPYIPDLVDFGNVILGQIDSCIIRTITLGNRSSSVPMHIRSVSTTAGEFSLVEAISDTVLQPYGTINIRVQFCPLDERAYSAQLLIGLGEGLCALDTTVILVGQAVQTSGRLVIERPQAHVLVFPPVLVGQETRQDTIVVKNIGNAPARIRVPVFEMYGSTMDSEVLRTSVISDVTLKPDSTLEILVQVLPAWVHDIHAAVIFSDSESWLDTVQLFGRGVQPGIQVSTSMVQATPVRVGDTSDVYEVLVYNLGSAPVQFNAVTFDSAQWKLVAVSRTLPVDLAPEQDTIHLGFKLVPNTEGQVQTTVAIENSSGIEPTVSLVGRGVLEHLAVDRTLIDFGCIASGTRKDSLNAFKLRNSGMYPLIVTGLNVAIGAGTFLVPGAKLPDTLAPGAERSYIATFRAGTAAASGRIDVQTSAPEQHSIALVGDVCQEIRRASIEVESASYAVGDYFVLPIVARFDAPPKQPIPYELTLTYSFDVLAPASLIGNTPGPAIIGGTISDGAVMVETVPGELTISGTIDPQRSGTMLVGIPMKVLLGPKYHTGLELKNVSLGAGSYTVTAIGGVFHALDCDTTGGGVVITGSYALEQNVPNSFNKVTTIAYQIARQEHVRVNLYDAGGTFIRAYVDEVQEPGHHQIHIEASSLSAGAYFYEIVSGRFRKTLRLVVD